ncbi:MAG: hypothetical protein MI861_10725, partial [Pirellulales bacterium]|nr:hypothetical protein [Pirellulales bacterium]
MSRNESRRQSEARRSFLKQLTAASLATLGMSAPRLVTAAEEDLIHPQPTADACILIWMAGGMAAPDTL